VTGKVTTRYLTASLLLSLLTFRTGALAQGSPLLIIESLPIPEQHVAMIREPMKCGTDGRIYVQFVSLDPEPEVNVISGDGKATYWISLNKVPGLRDGHVQDFIPDPSRGGAFLLIGGIRESEGNGAGSDNAAELQNIVAFDEKGNYVSATKLQADFFITRFAAFAKGDEFLVTGYRSKNLGSPEEELSPVTALFSSSGELLRYIKLERDVNKDSVTQHFHGNEPVSLGEIQIISFSLVESGDDGNVYLVRGTPAGPVYSISPGGEAYRITLTPPSDRAGLLSVKVTGTEIMAEYEVAGESGGYGTLLFVVSDRQGHSQHQYSISPRDAGLGMACYSGHTLTFLAPGKDGTLELRRARVPY
jgi:hypothetical protein